MMNLQLVSNTKTFICFCATFALLASSGLALADKDKAKEKDESDKAESAVELSAEHLGMSREALGRDKVVDSEEERAKKHHGEAKSPHTGEHHRAMRDAKHGCKHGEEHENHAKCDETCKAHHKGKGHGYNYKSCLEASIGANNGHDESARVCKSLFPETDS